MIDLLNPTKLCEVHNAIIADRRSENEYTPEELRRTIRRLKRYGWPLIGVLFWLPRRSNITVRHHFVLAGLYQLLGKQKTAMRHSDKAHLLLDQARPHGYYVDGLGYLEYCDQAFRFWHFARGISGLGTHLAMWEYAPLMSPEGTVPTNDTPRTDYRHLLGPIKKADYLHPYYSVFRFGADTFVMITHNPDILEHRSNLHVNFDFGHVVLFSRGKWRLAHNWYTSWPDKQDGDGAQCYAHNIPLDGIRIQEPQWRIPSWMLALLDEFDGTPTLLPGSVPLQLSFTRPTYNSLLLEYGGGLTRRITVHPDRLEIEDTGGTASVYNIDQHAFDDGFITDTCGLSFKNGGVSGGDEGGGSDVRRYRLHGEKRKIILWY